MKHLLIIFSFLLLLSSPLFGQETGVLYQYETSTGIQWKTFGDVKVPPEYEGEIRNGKPDGFGILIRFDGKKYVGEFREGLLNGQGTFTWSNGNKYVGGFKEGLLNGQGISTLFDGEKYVGEFKNGKRWNGTMYDKEGNIIGKWLNGKRQ